MSSALEIAAGTAVEVVIFGVAGGILYRVWRGASFLPQRRTLLPFNRGVMLEGEHVVKVLDPGTYWVKPRQSIVPVDIRARPFQTTPRELLTADRQGLRTRFSGDYTVVDPALFVRGSSDGHAALYLSLEREIGLAVAELNRSEILGSTISLADRVRERIEPRAAELGIVINHAEIADIIPIAWVQGASED